MSDDNWSNLHKKYADKEWSKLPSLFADEAMAYFPATGSLLELGTGVGQDGMYFAQKGYEVTATDLFTDTVDGAIQAQGVQHITTKVVDLRQQLSFEDESYDVVYAHLSLHYFDQQTTARLFDDIYRILKPGGVLALFTNSISDPEYGTGEKLEADYFLVDGIAKRYFSVETLRPFLQHFSVSLLDANGETYKDRAIGVHGLIRAVGIKQ